MPTQMMDITKTGTRDAGNADAIGAEGDKLILRREASKDQEDRGEKPPWDREGQGKRNDVRNEGEDELDRDIVIYQQVEQLLEDIAQHQDKGENPHGKQGSGKHLLADVPIKNSHVKGTANSDGVRVRCKEFGRPASGAAPYA